MKTTCVLFGAGADIPFGISGGKEFAFKVLGIDTDDMNNAIKKYFREKLPNYEHNTLRVDSNKNFKYIKINSSNGYSVFRACLEQ